MSMSSYAYEAVDPTGARVSGALEVADQSEALRRIRQMGLFPTNVTEHRENRVPGLGAGRKSARASETSPWPVQFSAVA